MKANEARLITRENLKGLVIQPYLAVIYARIVDAAKSGLSSISDPFYTPEGNSTLPWPSIDVEKALFQRLKEDGYEVTNHPDPDPGHPCSQPYTTISW